LEAQKLEVERIREAQRKAKEEAAAAARAQSERETNGGEHPSQRRSSGSEDEEEASRDQWHKPTVAIKVDDDQKVDDDDDGDTSAIYLAIPDEEHPESHLIMMAHVSYMSLMAFALGYDSNEKLIINRVLLRRDRGWMFSQLQQCPLHRLRRRSHRTILLIQSPHTLVWGTAITATTT
jgi:hypothetical protein